MSTPRYISTQTGLRALCGASEILNEKKCFKAIRMLIRYNYYKAFITLNDYL